MSCQSLGGGRLGHRKWGWGSCMSNRGSQLTLRVLSDVASFLKNMKNRSSCGRLPGLPCPHPNHFECGAAGGYGERGSNHSERYKHACLWPRYLRISLSLCWGWEKRRGVGHLLFCPQRGNNINKKGPICELTNLRMWCCWQPTKYLQLTQNMKYLILLSGGKPPNTSLYQCMNNPSAPFLRHSPHRYIDVIVLMHVHCWESLLSYQ